MIQAGRMALGRVLLIVCLPCSFLAAQQPDAALMQQYSREAQTALAESRYADAEKAYEKLAKLAPGIAEIHANLGLVYFQDGKYDRAVPALHEALKLNPKLSNAKYFLAMSLSELGRYEEAVPELKRGFKQAGDPALKRLLGLHLERAYTGLQRDDDAVEVALELTRLYPKDPEVLYQTGRLYGNYAYLAMQQLAKVAPNSIWRLQASAEVWESQGHYDLAITEYREILARDPRRPGIHYRLGRALLSRSQQAKTPTEAMKGQQDALAEFQQELQLDPTSSNAAYEAGEIYRKMGQLEKARELFETAVKYYPDFEEAQTGLGRVLVALGKPDLALTHLRKAVSLNPEDDVTYYQLALAFKALGKTDERRAALDKFQRLQAQRAEQQKLFMEASSPQGATKQELDMQPPQ
jgi:tetratricopeptide (TPR) repeat protein